MIKQLILVGIGGATGSMMRFLVSETTNKYNNLSFPIATFIVNMTGCILIGILIELLPANTYWRQLLIVGVCGGFTTFSAFANETLHLFNNNQQVMAVVYTLLSCIMGILAVWLGVYISNILK